MKDKNYSFLMSIYFKEDPDHLRESLKSMMEQTVSPKEIILVKDGPLTEDLEKVINEFKNSEILKVVALEKNVGLGEALNIGLKNCTNDLIARMDSDDISVAHRCENQLKVFNKNKELSVVGSSVAEFIENSNNVLAYKKSKTTHEEIKREIKYKNPMNHPTVMFKKSDVQKVGSYKPWFLNEDYFLWIRMLHQGFEFQNLSEPLVKMRITNETYFRRGGWKYYITQKKLFDYMLSIKMINILEYSYNNLIRFVVRILISNKLRKKLYLNLIRKN